MTTDLVLIAKSQGVTTVTLNRPEALNALSGALRQTLAETFDALREDAGEVDRIDGGEAHLFGESTVFEDRLHRGLRVVETALDREREDVIRARAGHLALL